MESVQESNWEGAIPVLISLAETSLSTPTAPEPLHAMLYRQTFLHIGLSFVIRRLHKFAPPSFHSPIILREEDYDDGAVATRQESTAKRKEQSGLPVCWFEDEATQRPLRWHVWVGVLYDLHNHPSEKLPWRIRLHFNNYPSKQILPLSAGRVQEEVRGVYQNSLKQAVTLRTGQARSSLQLLTKEMHDELWESLQAKSRAFKLYNPIAKGLHPRLDTNEDNTRIPIRVLINDRPALQKSCSMDDQLTLEELLLDWIPDVHLWGESDEATLMDWRIHGVRVSLHCSVLKLWTQFCHPDFFLYISMFDSLHAKSNT